MQKTYEVAKWVVQALVREVIRLLLRHFWERADKWE